MSAFMEISTVQWKPEKKNHILSVLGMAYRCWLFSDCGSTKCTNRAYHKPTANVESNGKKKKKKRKGSWESTSFPCSIVFLNYLDFKQHKFPTDVPMRSYTFAYAGHKANTLNFAIMTAASRLKPLRLTLLRYYPTKHSDRIKGLADKIWEVNANLQGVFGTLGVAFLLLMRRIPILLAFRTREF